MARSTSKEVIHTGQLGIWWELLAGNYFILQRREAGLTEVIQTHPASPEGQQWDWNPCFQPAHDFLMKI